MSSSSLAKGRAPTRCLLKKSLFGIFRPVTKTLLEPTRARPGVHYRTLKRIVFGVHSLYREFITVKTDHQAEYSPTTEPRPGVHQCAV